MTDSEQDEAHSDDALIRERLNSLLSEHSQSEIARKTGSLVASVNRYVHGARVPAAFCASLVRGLRSTAREPEVMIPSPPPRPGAATWRRRAPTRQHG